MTDEQKLRRRQLVQQLLDISKELYQFNEREETVRVCGSDEDEGLDRAVILLYGKPAVELRTTVVTGESYSVHLAGQSKVHIDRFKPEDLQT